MRHHKIQLLNPVIDRSIVIAFRLLKILFYSGPINLIQTVASLSHLNYASYSFRAERDVIAAITGVANGRQDVAGLEHHPVKTILVDSGNEVVLEVFRKV